jgi:hypothetical protein
VVGGHDVAIGTDEEARSLPLGVEMPSRGLPILLPRPPELAEEPLERIAQGAAVVRGHARRDADLTRTDTTAGFTVSTKSTKSGMRGTLVAATGERS